MSYIGWFNDVGILGRLKKTINNLMLQDRRKEVYALGKALVDGNGIRRILDKIYEY